MNQYAIFGGLVSSLVVWVGGSAVLGINAEPISEPTLGFLVPCIGCVAERYPDNEGGLEIESEPTPDNGDCTGTQPPCTEDKCTWSGALEVKNDTGITLYWREKLSEAETWTTFHKWLPGETEDWQFGEATEFSCASGLEWEMEAREADNDQATVAFAYKLGCSYCNTSSGS